MTAPLPHDGDALYDLGRFLADLAGAQRDGRTAEELTG